MTPKEIATRAREVVARTPGAHCVVWHEAHPEIGPIAATLGETVDLLDRILGSAWAALGFGELARPPREVDPEFLAWVLVIDRDGPRSFALRRRPEPSN